MGARRAAHQEGVDSTSSSAPRLALASHASALPARPRCAGGELNDSTRTSHAASPRTLRTRLGSDAQPRPDRHLGRAPRVATLSKSRTSDDAFLRFGAASEPSANPAGVALVRPPAPLDALEAQRGGSGVAQCAGLIAWCVSVRPPLSSAPARESCGSLPRCVMLPPHEHTCSRRFRLRSCVRSLTLVVVRVRSRTRSAGGGGAANAR